MQNNLVTPLKGTRDLYPEDMQKRRWLLNSVSRVIESYGYQEYDAPLLESFTLYAAKSSPEIIERQSYVFEDRGGERIVVRPEMTPSLARMIAARQRELPSILRWYSVPECWRYERPQKGRLRNFLQLNVDLIGSDSAQADTEILDLALSMIRSLGVDMSSIELRLNDRRLLEGWLADAAIDSSKWTQVFSLLDERDKLAPVEFRARLDEFVVGENAERLIQRLSLSTDELLADPWAERLRNVQTELSRLGWKESIRIDSSIIRGFAYYTGIIFEVYDKSGKFRRSIFGGGRYSKLVEDVGGTPVSGIGFGVSDVSLYELLNVQNLSAASIQIERIMVVPFSLEEEIVAQKIANVLRGQNLQVMSALPPYNVKAQLKLAEKLNVQNVVLVFPEELRRNRVIIRNMESGIQEIIDQSQLVVRLREKEAKNKN